MLGYEVTSKQFFPSIIYYHERERERERVTPFKWKVDKQTNIFDKTQTQIEKSQLESVIVSFLLIINN